MKKIMKPVCLANYEFDIAGTFEEMRVKMAEVENACSEYTNFRFEREGQYEPFALALWADRKETDEEWKKRYERMKKSELKAIEKKEKLEDKERKELARLKSKYEIEL